MEMRKKRKTKKRFSPKVFRPPRSKYFLITFKTILILLNLIGVASLFVWLFRGDLFKTRNIDCIKENFGCSPKEISLLEPLYGQNIFLLQGRIFSRNFVYNNPYISKVKITKKLPNSLKIILTPRKALAVIKTDRERFLIDDSGFVFAKAEKNRNKLPIIILTQSIAIGETLVGKIEKKTLILAKKLQESFIQFDKINLVNGDFLEVFTANKMIATFSGEKALAPQVDSLQYILHHSRMDGKVIRVDLRFDKPILVK